jgi:hypothetical protein
MYGKARVAGSLLLPAGLCGAIRYFTVVRSVISCLRSKTPKKPAELPGNEALRYLSVSAQEQAMKAIQLTARAAIHEGELEEFTALAAQCMRTVREKESGPLQYDWFFSEAQT